MKSVLSIAALWLASSAAAFAEAPQVAATIKPIHSLVAAVMGDVGTPQLIVRGGASPHTYSLRPSDAGALEQAGVVFWAGHGMELFLEDALDTLAGNARVVELARSPGINLLPIREGGVFEAHVDGDGHDEHDHDEHDHDDEHDDGDHVDAMDMHFFLDPQNAVAMVAQIAATLSAVDPQNASAYAANAAAETARLTALVAEIDAQLAPVRNTPFIVFHDAYQYLEHRFGLSIAGSITVTPDTMPGAARVVQIRERIATAGAACVFAEPQFEPAIIATVIEGSAAHAGTLDPEGSTLTEGPDLYPTLIRNLAAALIDCLER